jgi:hypothetical protein
MAGCGESIAGDAAAAAACPRANCACATGVAGVATAAALEADPTLCADPEGWTAAARGAGEPSSAAGLGDAPRVVIAADAGGARCGAREAAASRCRGALLESDAEWPERVGDAQSDERRAAMWRLECDEGRQVWKFDGKQQDEGAAADEKAFLATFAKNKNSADRIYRRSVARKRGAMPQRRPSLLQLDGARA